jgi:hypothetical protein
MRNALPFICIAAYLMLTGCENKLNPAFGLEDEIYVVADSAEFDQLKSTLSETFEKVIYTPQPEKIFTLKRVPVNEIEQFRTRKNILIVASLNSRSLTSDFIKAVTDTAIENKLIADKDFIIRKPDLWAKNQLVVILTAPTLEELENKIQENGSDILYSFQKVSDSRLQQSLYDARYEKKDIEGRFLKQYGWVIYVHSDLQVAQDKPEDNFVWLRTPPGSDRERWIFVHWIDNASPEYLNEDSIKAIRNRLTQKYYCTSDDSGYVVIAEDYFTTSEVNFNNRYALFTQGLWDLNIKGMGGPFINYIFFDEKTNRLYMLDGAVFAPKYYKRNLIQQTDVVLQSFMFDSEMSSDKKEQLLNAAQE